MQYLTIGWHSGYNILRQLVRKIKVQVEIYGVVMSVDFASLVDFLKRVNFRHLANISRCTIDLFLSLSRH